MTTLRSADTSQLTGAPDEKLLAAIGKYNQELLRAGSMLAVAPGPPDSQRASDQGCTRGVAVYRPSLYFL